MQAHRWDHILEPIQKTTKGRTEKTVKDALQVCDTTQLQIHESQSPFH